VRKFAERNARIRFVRVGLGFVRAAKLNMWETMWMMVQVRMDHAVALWRVRLSSKGMMSLSGV
jgi:hypothetical protein